MLMGYVLPIRQFEYENYHLRVMKQNPSTFKIEGPLPIMYHRNPEEFPFPLKKNETTYINQYESKKGRVDVQKISELTGKGIHFNETI